MDRLAMLKKMVAERPEEPFAHYGLAMELRKLGHDAEANAAFEALMQKHEGYLPTYLMAGNHFAAQGDKDKARAVYQKGLQVAGAAGDAHTQGEIEVALAELD